MANALEKCRETANISIYGSQQRSYLHCPAPVENAAENANLLVAAGCFRLWRQAQFFLERKGFSF
jgi:hypothetical protein